MARIPDAIPTRRYALIGVAGIPTFLVVLTSIYGINSRVLPRG